MMNIELARNNMIEQQIRPWNVRDAQVLRLLSEVKREDFVPPAQRALAFAEIEIPLPGGQCMLQPRLEARLLQDLAVQPHETVLEIGAGSGYMAALLGRRAQRVLTLDTEAGLVTLARANLQAAGVCNVEVRQGDGALPSPAEGRYDVVLLSGSVAEIPHHLLALLTVGGRLAAIVGDEPVMRCTRVTRISDTQFETRQSWDTVAPRLQHFAQPAVFSF